MPTYKIVLDNLKLPSKSNPQKSIADVILDGSYKKIDLQFINVSNAFPSNNYNPNKLPEGKYSTADAMMQFVRTIGPFLSDQALYKLTHTFSDIETENSTNQAAYRNSSLAKCFTIYELERHSDHVTKEKPIPAVFLSHMKTHVLPLCQRYWPKSLQSNIDTFGSFNFKNDLMDKSAKQKFKEVGCDVDFDGNITSLEEAIKLKQKVEQNYPFHSLVEGFKAEDLQMETLSTTSEQQPSHFPALLQELEKKYQAQNKEEVSKLGGSALSKITGPAAQSAPVKPVTKKQHSSFNLNPFNWFGSSNKKPVTTSHPELQRRAATFSLNPEMIKSDVSLRESPTASKRNAQLRNTHSFMGSPIQLPSERTVEVVQKELDSCRNKLSHYTKLHLTTVESVSKFSAEDNSPEASKLRNELTKYAERKNHYSKKVPLLVSELEALKKSQLETKRQYN